MNFRILTLLLIGFTATINVSSAQSQSEEPEIEKKEIEYQEPSLSNLSKTYWRLMKFDSDDDSAIDNYMKINECELYNEFYHNEFEWSGIRESGRKLLNENKKDFPVHYRFVQPLALGEYSFDRQGFNIADEYKINGLKKFEVASNELYREVCGDKRAIPGYPSALVIELTRPFIFDFVEYEEQRAKSLIKNKMKSYENLLQHQKSRENYLKSREIYLVSNIKMFAYKPKDVRSQHGYYTAKFLSILESIEVYSDKELTQLMYKKDFRRKRVKREKKF